MNQDKAENNHVTRVSMSKKQMIIHLTLLMVTVVLTAAVSYALTSNQYLNQLDSQNQQIRNLQNALRNANGLSEVET